MRILWLSPWLRPLARANAEGLQALGAEVMLITAPLHPESDTARGYEIELLGRPLPHRGWLPFFDAYQRARRFEPDIVVTELLRDFRWRAFGHLAPRVRILHDAAPHDPTETLPWWTRLFFERWDETANATIVFSEHVRKSYVNRMNPVRTEAVYLAPLTSDLDNSAVPQFVAPEQRRNFVLIGRQKPYKNHRVVFDGWEAHTRSQSWRGDNLILIGSGEIDIPLPPHCQWRHHHYRYSQVLPEIAQAKGSVVHNRAASQSGVHVLSMQLGVPTLVSTAGGLPEYQPPGLEAIGIDDIEGLTATFNALADPAEVDLKAKLCLAHYRAHYDASIAARALYDIFADVAQNSRPDGFQEIG